MITVYKLNLERGKVESVLCERAGYPNKDVNGEVMFFNSHFETEADAKKALIANLSAWVESENRELNSMVEREKALKSNVRRIKSILSRLKKDE